MNKEIDAEYKLYLPNVLTNLVNSYDVSNYSPEELTTIHVTMAYYDHDGKSTININSDYRFRTNGAKTDTGKSDDCVRVYGCEQCIHDRDKYRSRWSHRIHLPTPITISYMDTTSIINLPPNISDYKLHFIGIHKMYSLESKDKKWTLTILRSYAEYEEGCALFKCRIHYNKDLLPSITIGIEEKTIIVNGL